MPEVFISRQPLVNRQSKIIATRLTLHPPGGATLKDAADALALLAEFWPQGEKLVFINCGSTCDASVSARCCSSTAPPSTKNPSGVVCTSTSPCRSSGPVSWGVRKFERSDDQSR